MNAHLQIHGKSKVLRMQPFQAREAPADELDAELRQLPGE